MHTHTHRRTPPMEWPVSGVAENNTGCVTASQSGVCDSDSGGVLLSSFITHSCRVCDELRRPKEGKPKVSTSCSHVSVKKRSVYKMI